MRHKLLIKRSVALIVFASFVLQSFLASAGVHYDRGGSHVVFEGTFHEHHSHLCLENLSFLPKPSECCTEKENDHCFGVSSEVTQISLVVADTLQQDKPFTDAGKQEFKGFAKLSAIEFFTVAYQSLSHHRLSVRGPPTSLI